MGGDQVGVLSGADANITEHVVDFGYDAVMGLVRSPSLAVDLSQVSCGEAGEMFAEIETALERMKVTAALDKLTASRSNAQQSKNLRKQVRQTGAATAPRNDGANSHVGEMANTQEAYRELYLRGVQVLEQFTLKCGKVDAYCQHQHDFLLNEFKDLQQAKEKSEDLAYEAGWMRAEADKVGSTEALKARAVDKLGEAQQSMSEIFSREQAFEAALHVKAAACGPMQPQAPWTVISDACSQTPEDPLMRAMLRERPSDFNKGWRERIGKASGIDPDLVRIEITGCLH